MRELPNLLRKRPLPLPRELPPRRSDAAMAADPLNTRISIDVERLDDNTIRITSDVGPELDFDLIVEASDQPLHRRLLAILQADRLDD